MLKRKRFSKPLLILLTVSIFIGLHLFVVAAIVLTLLFYAFSNISRCVFNTHSMILNIRSKDKTRDITAMWSSGSSSLKYVAVGNTQRVIDLSESTDQLTEISTVEIAGSEDALKIIWINK